MKILKRIFGRLIISCLAIIFYNEFLLDYITISQVIRAIQPNTSNRNHFHFQCNWPAADDGLMQGSAASKSIKAVILADIHMLGPFQGHWADRIYREWHMHRAFQTTMTLFRPDVVFILGASSSHRIIEKNDLLHP